MQKLLAVSERKMNRLKQNEEKSYVDICNFNKKKKDSGAHTPNFIIVVRHESHKKVESRLILHSGSRLKI
jgi:hypothetical protein